MSHSGNFQALLDACVLYPASTRDTILSLADQGLFRPKWSKQIQGEWKRNLMANRPDIPEEILERTISQMEKSFPDAEIDGYEEIASNLSLPDPDDNHVLAAAIVGQVDVIVTNNTKDFPQDYLSRYNIEVVDPDSFIVNLIDLDPELALQAIQKQSNRLKDPPKTINEIINTLEQNGLMRAAEKFRALI